MPSPSAPCYLVALRPKYLPQHPILEHPRPMLLPLCGRTSFTPIPNKTFAFYSCIISLSLFLCPARGFYLLSPFVFSSIFPFCLILICFLAKGPLSLKYPVLSLLEETYYLHLQGYISPHLILGLLNPFWTPVTDYSNTEVIYQKKEVLIFTSHCS